MELDEVCLFRSFFVIMARTNMTSSHRFVNRENGGGDDEKRAH